MAVLMEQLGSRWTNIRKILAHVEEFYYGLWREFKFGLNRTLRCPYIYGFLVATATMVAVDSNDRTCS